VRFWWGNLNERELCGGLGVGVSVILKLILKERGGRVDFAGSTVPMKLVPVTAEGE
jgi:hypothetical protein